MVDKKGVMCVDACPLLEDELVYSMYTDPQPQRILLADTEPAVSIKRKMDAKGMKYELITEKEFFHVRDNLNKDEFNILIYMNSLGLHAEPEKLKDACIYFCFHLKETLDFPSGPVDMNPTCQCRGPGFYPWSGEIPHAWSS